MKNKLSLAITCGLAATCVATTGFASEKSFNIGGDIELDITASEDDLSSNFNHGGRVRLNAVGMVKNENGYFIKGKAVPSLKFNPGGSEKAVQTDDLFVQAGKQNSWDVQLGRFEGYKLFVKGRDTLISHAGGVPVYEANYARGRKDDVLHGALHVGSKDSFHFELGVMGNKSGSDKFTAIRPVIAYNLGSVKLHAGLEKVSDNGVDKDGLGLGAAFKLGSNDINLAYAKADPGSADVSTIGLNVANGPFGIGYIHSEVDGNNAPSVDTVYASYETPLFGLKDTKVIFALNTSKADNVGSNDSLNAARIRLKYKF